MKIEKWLDTKLGQDIWNSKYRFKNETFDEWLDRVSNGNSELKQLIIDKKFLFGGRTLSNYNTGVNGSSTSNCYSSGYAPDDLEELLELNKNIGLTYKAQGGQGLSLSKIRPKGCKLSGGYETDGIVPFMKIFNATTESVSQGGARKGALMMSLDIWHKEAETFIKIKSEEGAIEGANLSLEIDDEFMQCVEEYYKTGKEVTVTRTFKYETGSIEYEITPIKLYKELCQKAYDWAEPGIIYTNRFRNYNIMEFIGDYEIVTGNPCGEQPLPKDGACNLGSLNLSEFVINPYTSNAKFDFDSLAKSVKIAIRALDDVIDYGYEHHALKSQRDMAYNYRNIGLGIMGLGSMLFKLGMKYGENRSIALIDSIMNNIFRSAIVSSSELAKEKGVFPKYSDKVFESTIIKRHFSEKEIEKLKKYGLRNCSLLSVAPSGSIATMLNITTGVEPAFRISYKRKTKSLHKDTDVSYDVYIREAEEYRNLHKTDILPDYFISSEDISYKDRIAMQSIIQTHVDTAISSTVNLPNSATIEDVENLYMLAWKRGLKGITVYRDGCKRGAILTSNTDDNKKTSLNELQYGNWKKKAEDTVYYNRKINIGCGKLKLMIGWSEREQKIQDMYVVKSGSGGCTNNLQGMVIAMSGMLRLGGEIFNIEKAFKGIGSCNSFTAKRVKGEVVSKGNSCGSAILNEIKAFLNEMNASNNSTKSAKKMTEKNIENLKVDEIKFTKEELDYKKENGEIAFAMKYNKCPKCSEKLEHVGGCISCQSCSFSKCE